MKSLLEIEEMSMSFRGEEELRDLNLQHPAFGAHSVHLVLRPMAHYGQGAPRLRSVVLVTYSGHLINVIF